MKYHIWTIGCQMNSADSQRLGLELERLGFSWTDEVEAADVFVMNTCVVRQQVEDKVYGRLGALRPIKEARPDMVIGLMGCLVGHKPSKELARRFPDVDVFIPPSEWHPLTDLLRARAVDEAARDLEAAQLATRWQVQDAVPAADVGLPATDRGRLVSAHVPVVYGCNWVCTFCIIPARRGPERSRPMDDIVRQVTQLAQQGVREVTLLGQIVDRYGYDWGEHDALPRLLRRLNGVDGIERIRFLTSHPQFMTPELLDTVAELPKVMEHIEVPFQAGDDAVLARMKRGYTVDTYRRLVADIRARIPGVAIHTDVIVGFCGETEAEFQATADLLAELKLDKAHIAKFSSRPGTVAAKLFVDDVPAEEKERRRALLDAIQEQSCAEINAGHVGRTVPVLVEARDKARWRGRTRTNKLVFFADPRPLLGQVVDVAITWSGPWSMVGSCPDAPVAARPEHDVIALSAV
jgi:tRNA-2-methylthio-N6-dimethylallyladenosine synthase